MTWGRTPLVELKLCGLGPRSKEKLIEAGVTTFAELLHFLPREYHDFSQTPKIAEAPLNEVVQISGEIISKHFSITPKQRIPMMEILVDDDFGTLRVVWFQQAYLREVIQKGVRIQLRGKIKMERAGRTMTNPQFQLGDTPPTKSSGVEPIYRQIGGLRSDQIAGWIHQLIDQMPDEEPLPAEVLRRFDFPNRRQALSTLHRPQDPDTAAAIRERRSPALRRLIFDEFFTFQTRMRALSKASQERDHARVRPDTGALAAMIESLPFRLTGDQSRVIGELMVCLEDGGRLHALIQGDVGCGKTVVGLAMARVFAASGLQSALLCPTTVLAAQHFQTAKQLLEPAGVRIALATRTEAPLDAIREGDVDLVIGTHKLLQDDVTFAELALVMIDEQHRFGVDQRGALLKKSRTAAHYLAFSATPIPRSLAMTLYGDYQVLQIREKPARRAPIKTILKRAENRQAIIDFAKGRMSRGETVYWVFPLIDGDEEQSERSATAMYDRFTRETFADFGVGLVHGRRDREVIREEMRRFREGEIQILVATTVIEVGVDAPEASIMVIEDAQRFGLSQLHQLRGRVGRGDRPGYCCLLVQGEAPKESLTRLKLLVSTQDGFDIAEQDLRQRGAGELLGKRQTGLMSFDLGDPWRDRQLMTAAREAAERFGEQAEPD